MTDDAGVPDAAAAHPTEPVTPAAAPAGAPAAAPAPPPEKPSWWRRTAAVSVFAMVWIAIVLLVGGFLIGRYVHVGDDGGHHHGRFGRGGYEFRGPMGPGYRFGPDQGGMCVNPYGGGPRMRGPNGGMQVVPCAPVPQAPAAPSPTTVAPSTTTTTIAPPTTAAP